MAIAKINGVMVTIKDFMMGPQGLMYCKVKNEEFNYNNWVLAALIDIEEVRP